MQNPSDPFVYKAMPRWHWQRVAHVFTSRYEEQVARIRYLSYQIPLTSERISSFAEFDSEDTAVTATQMGVLVYFVKLAGTQSDRPVVEIGSYRGVTTTTLAKHTS